MNFFPEALFSVTAFSMLVHFKSLSVDVEFLMPALAELSVQIEMTNNTYPAIFNFFMFNLLFLCCIANLIPILSIL